MPAKLPLAQRWIPTTTTMEYPTLVLYVLSGGVVRLVARTGTVILDVGTIANLSPPVAIPNSFLANSSSAILNDRGQLFFQATLTDGTGVLLLATPDPGNGSLL